MRHFILTRFNLPLNNGQTDKNHQTVLSPEWYSHRHQLFEKFYLPSIQNQTNQNFEVLLAFDKAYPEHYERYDFPNNIRIVHEWPANLLPKNELILTSRIDNDDAYKEMFIEKVQAAAEQHGPDLIIDSFGDVVKEDGTFIRDYKSYAPTSPFLNIYSSSKTCYSGQHTNLFTQIPKRCIIPESLFIQVIHDRNLCNT